MKKFLGLLIVGMLFCMSSYSQIIEPVKWKVSMQGESNEKEIVFHAYIEDGWHLYATDIPPEVLFLLRSLSTRYPMCR